MFGFDAAVFYDLKYSTSSFVIKVFTFRAAPNDVSINVKSAGYFQMIDERSGV